MENTSTAYRELVKWFSSRYLDIPTNASTIGEHEPVNEWLLVHKYISASESDAYIKKKAMADATDKSMHYRKVRMKNIRGEFYKKDDVYISRYCRDVSRYIHLDGAF